MNKIIFFVSLFFTIGLTAQTDVSGNQSGTWTLDESPYNVIGHITIPTGQTLNIDAGVEVNFQGYYKFNVNGKLLVNGVEGNRVVFTTGNTSTGWGGIRFNVVSQISEFRYCTIEYGKTSTTGSYPDMHGGAVMLKESNAEFYNCIFANNDATGSGDDGMGGAVYAINTGTEDETLTKFIDCQFINNHASTEGGAIKFTNDGNTELTRCVFNGNSANYGGGAILFYSAVDVNMTNCLFYNNSANNSGGGAIKSMNPSVSLHFKNCTFYDNTAYGAGEGGAADMSYTDATFVNCIIYDNNQTYGKDINVGMGSTATINFCDVDMPDYAEGSNNLSNVNPLFINSSTGNFHLQASSPCIDMGTDIGLPFVGSNPDMGCFEFGDTTAVQDELIYSFNLYPNPTKNQVTITSEFIIKDIQIINLLGEIVLEKEANNKEITLDLSQLNNGTYLGKLQLENQVYSTTKIVVAH